MTTPAWSPNPQVVWRALSDGGVLVVDRGSGDHWTLNRVAGSFLSACAAGASFREAVERVGAGYQPRPPSLEEDLRQLAGVLAAEGILIEREGG